jgi:hypothetical protein
MAQVQSIKLETISEGTIFDQLNSISVINQSTFNLDISDMINGGRISLTEGQSVTITSSTGFVLPKLRLDSEGDIIASVITT